MSGPPPPSMLVPPMGPEAFLPEVWATLPHDRNPGPAIAVTVVCLVLAVAVVSLRVYTRWILLNNFGVDDWFAIFSLLGVVFTATIIIMHTRYGLGTHVWDISGREELIAFFQLLYAQLIVYYTTLFLIKLILCAQYHRLISEVPQYRIPCRIIMGVTASWCIVSVFLMAFQCTPVAAFWDKSLLLQPGASCHPEIYGPAAAIGNIATDFILLILPTPVIWRLNLKTGQKWVIFGIFGIGSFACIVSILRVALLPGIPDVTYSAAYTACWTMAETTAGIVCPCLMTLGPILKRVRPSLGFSNKSSDPGRQRTKSHTKHSGQTENGLRSRSSRMGHSAWVGNSQSQTELCREDSDEGPGASHRHSGRTVNTGSEEGAIELGPVPRPHTDHRRDS